eukprot:scaffold282895_cov28-Tisochrysis_lutea.AAC.2
MEQDKGYKPRSTHTDCHASHALLSTWAPGQTMTVRRTCVATHSCPTRSRRDVIADSTSDASHSNSLFTIELNVPQMQKPAQTPKKHVNDVVLNTLGKSSRS